MAKTYRANDLVDNKSARAEMDLRNFRRGQKRTWLDEVEVAGQDWFNNRTDDDRSPRTRKNQIWK